MKKNLKQLIKVVLCATFLFSTMLTVMPVKGLNCKNVNVIFMRGSSQNYIAHNGEDVNFPVWQNTEDKGIKFTDYRFNKDDSKEPSFVTTENESLKYFKSTGDRIHKDYADLSMQFVSLHNFFGKYNTNGYRAVSAFGPKTRAFVSNNIVDAKFGNYEIVGDVTGGEYNNSVQDGAEELAGYLQDQMVSCPSQLNIVGGFSQGAQVVGVAMQKMHDQGLDKLLSRLGHVDMYGDPKFNGFELTTNRFNPARVHSTLPWTRGSATTNHVGTLGPRKPYVPDILTAKTTSWCDFNDIVCGGYAGLAIKLDAHSEVYKADNGWIEKSANEIYVDIKTRLALLAGLTDTSANSPLAYWNGIKHPKKLDVMFVMDRTGDENISLIPDPSFMTRNMLYLAEEGFTSSQIGVVTYTEFGRFDGTKTLIESFVKTPTNLTEDIFSNYSYLNTSWGPAHFQNPPFGGEDQQDSPYSAISTALDQDWRSDARKVILLFSTSWGKEKEDTTNLTMNDITAKARTKDVEILPVFTSRTIRATDTYEQSAVKANDFYKALSKGVSGHYTEVTSTLGERLIYDVIMRHVFAPDVEITTGKTYNAPSKTTKKTAAKTTIKNTKPVFKVSKKVVLSAGPKSNAPKSKIKTYAWDLNGDGIPDQTSTLPDIETVYDAPFSGTVSVDVTDEAGNTTTGFQDIEVTDDDTLVTHQEPAILPAPVVGSQRSGNDVILSWPPAEGDLTIADADGAVMVTTNGMSGSLTLKDVPQTAFSLFVQLHLGADTSDSVEVAVGAAPIVDITPAVVVPPPDVTLPKTPVPTELPPPANTTNPTPLLVNPQDQTTPPTGPSPVVAPSSELVVKNPTAPGSVAVVQKQIAPTVLVVDSPVAPQARVINDVLGASTTSLPGSDPGKAMFGRFRLGFVGVGTKIKLIFGLVLSATWPDNTVMFLVLILLLIMLDTLTCDRKNKLYEHDKRYFYSQKSLKQTSYKV